MSDLAGLISGANNIVVLTGAGISTESGIPDFRSPGGIWEKFQEKTFQINVSEKTVPEVIEKIMSIIMNKKGNEIVDWLELVRKNNDLGKFFVD